ncbi:protein phosphatase 1 regulatory subunit 14C-like [Haliotis cracherodii]|uniref:protein phosphatase 1 regulatory subunit 14C-like n=1 Tax=Haliotis cracherodii TaxID=6455 RepID=UPI0039E85017
MYHLITAFSLVSCQFHYNVSSSYNASTRTYQLKERRDSCILKGVLIESSRVSCTMSRFPFSRKTVGFYQVMATPVPQAPESSCTMDYRQHDSNKKSVLFRREQDKETKKKYFTQKYGQDQMMLIRKRLAVEDWVFEQLRDLYNCVEAEEDHNCKLDLEEVLNFDNDMERREYALSELTDAKKPEADVFKFVDELLQKARTL